MSTDTLVETVTLSQAKALINCMAHQQSLLFLSPPGVGKSDSVMQAAAEAGLPCRSLLGTQIAPEDVSGIPRIVGERSVFCPPRILLPEQPEPFCLFLDELPACAPDIQKAFYSLLLERRLGEHALAFGRVSAQDAAIFCAMAEEAIAGLRPIEEYLLYPELLPAQDTARWFVLCRIRALLDRGELAAYPPEVLHKFLLALPQEHC